MAVLFVATTAFSEQRHLERRYLLHGTAGDPLHVAIHPDRRLDDALDLQLAL